MLPSQIGRPASSRAHMYSRTRSHKLLFGLVAIAVFAATYVVIKLWPGAGHGAAIDSASAASNDPIAPASAIADIELRSPAHPSAPASAKANSPGKSTAGAKTSQINMGAPAGGASPVAAKPAVQESPAPPPSPPPQPPSHPASQVVAASGDPLPETSSAAPKEPLASSPRSPASPSTFSSTGAGSKRVPEGLDLLARNKPVDGRMLLSDALVTEKLDPADADRLRQTLAALNQKMVFGPDVAAGDPYARAYTVESGDILARLPKKLGLKTDYRFIQRINNLATDRLRETQRLKVVTGPFHAVVVKREFRMDLFEGDGDQRVFVCSYPVGLGEYGATPEGVFAVRPNSKLINPRWVNPRTGQVFEPDDPQNPIGERWIGLVGVSDNIRDLAGYGIHGTIDPDSIGKQKSMGCIRMKAEDVEVVYELLMENVSRIEVHGEDYP